MGAFVLLGYSKAFDCDRHRRLLRKLPIPGFDENSLKLNEYYLTERSCRTVVDAFKSKDFKIKLGVPHGSVLGPLMFILYTADIAFQHVMLAAIKYSSAAPAPKSFNSFRKISTSYTNGLLLLDSNKMPVRQSSY